MKPEIIDNSVISNCWKCNGTGKIDSGVNCNCKEPCIVCDVCNGTGKWREEHCIIVANGIAIDSDSIGK